NSHFLTHCAVMPGWHKLVVLLAFFLAVAGFAGVLVARSVTDPHVQISSRSNTPGASDKQAQSDSVQHVGSLSRAAMPAMVIGVSVLAGFVGGWLLRAYLVPGMSLAVIAVACVWALSHFGILHLGGSSADASGNPAAAGGPAAWFAEYAMHLKDAALAHLPSAGGGTFAAFLGFRRW